MTQTLTLKVFTFIYLALLGGGIIMEIPNLNAFMDPDQSDQSTYKWAFLITAIFYFIEKAMSIRSKKQKSDMELYEKKREIDSRYKDK
tara:strand:- start:195 stop:458 length:264 start_codon:yes stop_codon:yes gene_type:complete